MARSSIPKFRPWRAPQGIHLLLSVGIPSVFCTLVVGWLTERPPVAELAGAWVYAFVLALWAPWRLRTHQGPLIKVWLWAVATLGLYGYEVLLEGRPWPEAWGPSGQHLLWWLVGLVQGQLAALWAGQLASRARLIQLIEGVPEGRALEERVREFQLDADFSGGNQRTLQGSLGVFGVLAVVLATVSPHAHVVALAGFLGACLLVGVVLRVYRREMEALMYGRRLSWGAKVAPLGWSALLLVLAALGAWALVQVGPWFDWNALPSPPGPPPSEIAPPNAPLSRATDAGEVPPLAVLLALLALIFRVPVLVFVLQSLVHLALALVPWGLVAFLLWPLVRWFLSGGRETKGLLRRWWRLLVAQVRAFVLGLRTLPAATKTSALGSAREWAQDLLKARGAHGRVPYPEVVRAFLRLVDWAQPRVAYHSAETTREYLRRLARELPHHGADLAQVDQWLEEELFGPRGLSAVDRRRYLALVARLVSSPPSRESDQGVS